MGILPDSDMATNSVTVSAMVWVNLKKSCKQVPHLNKSKNDKT